METVLHVLETERTFSPTPCCAKHPLCPSRTNVRWAGPLPDVCIRCVVVVSYPIQPLRVGHLQTKSLPDEPIVAWSASHEWLAHVRASCAPVMCSGLGRNLQPASARRWHLPTRRHLGMMSGLMATRPRLPQMIHLTILWIQAHMHRRRRQAPWAACEELLRSFVSVCVHFQKSPSRAAALLAPRQLHGVTAARTMAQRRHHSVSALLVCTVMVQVIMLGTRVAATLPTTDPGIAVVSASGQAHTPHPQPAGLATPKPPTQPTPAALSPDRVVNSDITLADDLADESRRLCHSTGLHPSTCHTVLPGVRRFLEGEQDVRIPIHGTLLPLRGRDVERPIQRALYAVLYGCRVAPPLVFVHTHVLTRAGCLLWCPCPLPSSVCFVRRLDGTSFN